MDGFNNENNNGIAPENPQGNGMSPENVNTPAEPSAPESSIPVQDSTMPVQNSGNSFTEQPVQNAGNSFTEQPAQNDGNSFTEQPVQNDGNSFTEQPAQNGNDYYMPQKGNISSAFVQSHPENIQPPEKKKPIWPLIAALVLLLLVAGGIIAFLKRDTIANTWASMTMEPDEYFRYVVKKQLGTGDLLDEYDKSAAELAKLKDLKMEGEFRLNINDDIRTVLEGTVSEEYNRYKNRLGVYGGSTTTTVDLSAYKDIALVWEMEQSGGVYSAMQALQIKNKDYLISLEEMYDSDSSTAYFRIPQANEEYAGVTLSNFLKEDDIEKLNDVLDNGKKMQNALPSSKTIKGIYERYFDLMLDQIKDVEKETEQIEVNGVKQKLTALKFVLDEDTQRSMAEELLNELKNDGELEDMIYDLAKQSGAGDDADLLWKEMENSIDEALDKLDDTEFDLEPEVTMYVASDGKIAGILVEEGKDHVFAGWIRKGTKIYCELSCVEGKKDLLALNGSGSMGLKGLNMDFHTEIEEEDLEFDFSLENVGLNGGTFRMDMEPFIDKAIDASKGDKDLKKVLNLLDGELVITAKNEGLKSSVSYSLEDGGERIVGLDYSMTVSESKGIELPGKRDVTEIDSTMELLPYLQDCDLVNLIDAAETLGLPSEATQELRSEVKQLQYY